MSTLFGPQPRPDPAPAKPARRPSAKELRRRAPEPQERRRDPMFDALRVLDAAGMLHESERRKWATEMEEPIPAAVRGEAREWRSRHGRQ